MTSVARHGRWNQDRIALAALKERLSVDDQASARWKEALGSAIVATETQRELDRCESIHSLARVTGKRDLAEVLRVAHLCASVRTDQEFSCLLSYMKHLIPFEKALAVVGPIRYPPAFLGPTKILALDFPMEWLSLYFHRNYAQLDPVLRFHLLTFQTQLWSQTFQSCSDPQLGDFLADASAFGLTEGITTGAQEPAHGLGTLFSFVGCNLGENSRHLLVVDVLRPHLHAALLHVALHSTPTTPYRLSLREREVLHWVKEGKTNWEISRILGVSESTIKFHIKNILAKLDASTRSQAAALAVQHRLL
ncbi:helix-turn-helix transcriptional regulator [Candidatus Methylacidithermus pantelleriae]|uniref:HTH luxR-type domain-containing protein n=1 Tax=Candidatus Methylacidithermus pantelleriae TaxID=2744239 RepID=A0A8J2BS35_9BACT|nr:LuxR family transcriptional regulator [Candidatus Methylacidithermus pantelleriae]CAF0703297.1 hypothetical protein MPNT_550001 [Candidatus Methylacidithermus pantelleriae]